MGKRLDGRRRRVWSQKELDEAVHAGRAVFIYDSAVYDMTRWLPNHPGGRLAVERLVGRDATDVIRVMHPQDVLQRMLPYFRVGTFPAPEKNPLPMCSTDTSNACQTPDQSWHKDKDSNKDKGTDGDTISHDFRKLNDQLHEAGFFETRYSAYVWEFVRLTLFFAAAIYLGVANPFRYAWVASAIVLSMFWHQASFVVHDAGHNGITHRRGVDYVLGAFLACGMGGLSIGWWKKSHNVHHIITNHPEHDPDIQLVPFFALSERYFGATFSTYHNKMLHWNRVWRLFAQFQHYLYYIILAFGRFNLFVQGWLYLAFDADKYRRNLEIVLQCCYWAWYSYFLACLPDTTTRLLHVLLSFVGTSILHVQITLSHFGMPADDGPEGECFAARQLRTTMDVDCPWWLDWFHGGLQFQALHHLFPQLPRHRLRSIQPLVIEFCRKHNLVYTYHSFYECNRMVLSSMRRLAIKAAATTITTTTTTTTTI
ncbi:delta-6-fatty acid desaturase [Syncephalis pseudoplumigaleata]|uniref:Delta-6-fatty acid desaturase n=1 Tax=Syncephalis pseudoplumigaleata TaxID=1712513 RepID=A0A4P9Z6A3_9FUNG|nr:delta-6-fatty acid desaturase [Syncephalis pseudoplumigaleata]|eukprot:RKP28116.1 delta-6-fatty acid desaturase [Syncephalis pseudoplumigaleata]